MKKLFALTLLILPLASFPALAQDVSRPSVASFRASESVRQAPASAYNVKAGPVQMLFNASFAGEYNTNINLANTGAKKDFILRPRAGMGLYYPITRLNNLRLNIGVGYDFYLENPEYGGQSLLIAPDTEMVFNVFVKDFRITFFLRPSITNTPDDNPTLSDVSNYTIFNNTVGVNIMWDLNDVILGAGYNRFDQFAINSEYNYLNRQSNQAYLNGAYVLAPYLRVGTEATVTFTDYYDGELNNSNNYTIGGTVGGNVSRYLAYTGGVGWQAAVFNNNTSLFTGNYSKPYFYLNLDNTLNRDFSHRISTGFEGMPSTTSNMLSMFFVRYAYNWNLINDVNLSGSAFYENGTETGSIEAEDFNRVGVTIALSYQFFKKWRATLEYGYLVKDSTITANDYNQNRVQLGLAYTF